jgi:phosphoglycerol transferase MdoB-like AlkP superfamily enzyme
VWAVAALFAKQLMLFEQALLEPTAVAYWLAIVTSAVPPLAVDALVPRRTRPLVLWVVGTFGSLLLLGDIVYYRFFGDVLSTPALLAIRQTGRVTGTIATLVTPDLLWFVVDIPFAAWLAVRLMRTDERGLGADLRRRVVVTSAVAAIGAGGVAVAAPGALRDAPLDQMFRNRAVVEELGGFGYHAYDAWRFVEGTAMRPAATETEVQQTTAWFRDRAPLRSGPASPQFGAARGKNLIVIQVESLQDFVIDYRTGGQDVMPHLRRWSDEAYRFTNVTDQTNEGRTSDAEFVALTSLLPLDHGAVAFRYPGNHYVGFPGVLAQHGYSTLSAVPFEAGFWNRRVLHPAYGFERSLFEPDFDLTEQIGWGLNDHDFLQQMVRRLEGLPRPFCAWLITLSLHHPFEGFPDRHKVLRLGDLEGTPFGNYLHTMRFFDQALEDFRQALQRDRLLEDTVLVVFGDHDAGFAHDPALARRIGVAGTEVGWMLADRVPFFVRLPGQQDGAGWTHAIGTPAGQSDFAPTLLALLGIDAAPLPYVGRNLLGDVADVPVLRPYGDWLDRAHLFVNHGTEGHGPVCYATGPRRPVDAVP